MGQECRKIRIHLVKTTTKRFQCLRKIKFRIRIKIQNSCVRRCFVLLLLQSRYTVCFIKNTHILNTCVEQWRRIVYLCVCVAHFFRFGRSHTFFYCRLTNVSFVTSSHVIRSHCERLSRLHPLVFHATTTETTTTFVCECECMCFVLSFFYDSS